MEHVDMKSSSDSKLQIGYICSIRIISGNWDIVEKTLQLINTLCNKIVKKVLSKNFRRNNSEFTNSRGEMPNRYVQGGHGGGGGQFTGIHRHNQGGVDPDQDYKVIWYIFEKWFEVEFIVDSQLCLGDSKFFAKLCLRQWKTRF